MKLTVDSTSCMGQGMCHVYASEVYDLDDDGRSVLRFEELPIDLHDEARDGAEACPQRAITIQE
jgi:ferredoxin